MSQPVRKKLIEVAMPLPEINDASAYDKMPGIGPHPKGIHQWWARLPLPTARAILFASVVDDPEAHPEKWATEEAQNAERERLFDIIRRLMGKQLHKAPAVYAEARAEMLKHCEGNLPFVLDPFAGGGSIPLEALRLGLPTMGSDLNPVAALINKALLELLPTWADQAPVNPETRHSRFSEKSWQGAEGLAEDVRYYSNRILERGRKALLPLYPKGPHDQTAVAWLWCRTVASPDPACHGVHVPLIRSLKIGKKKGEIVWLKPMVDRSLNTWTFAISADKPSIIATVGRQGGKCIISGTSIPLDYIRSEGRGGRIKLRLIGIVGDGREYFEPDVWPKPSKDPEVSDSILSETMPYNPFAVRPPLYGFMRFREIFTPRQLHALHTFSDLIRNIRADILRDADDILKSKTAILYADAVTTFLSFVLDRCVDFNNSLCRWSSSNEKVMSTFGRQAIPMIWDFAEANLLAESVGGWKTCSDYVAACIEVVVVGNKRIGSAKEADAAETRHGSGSALVSTDPPYYNNVDYADLSDFFYVWLRPILSSIYPELFSTVLTPKTTELVASPYRFNGDKEAARDHFEAGFREVFSGLRGELDERFPMTVYYAFKQADEIDDVEDDSTSTGNTTGWETLLEALVGSGFQITGTWPVRASQKWRQMSMGMNALASYIVLACRPRPAMAPQIASTQFRQELRRVLPEALRHLQQGNIAPVDFAQAALGPGMAVYSRYGRILDSSGKPMSVRGALTIINQSLTEVLSELEDDFDADTRWAIAWFEQYDFRSGDYGDAEVLSKAKVTSVGGLQQGGIVASRGGKVRLLRPEELPAGWDPTTDRRLTVWEMTHHLLRVYHYEQAGDEATAVLLRKLGSDGDVARELAYRLFNIAEKKKLSKEAQGYNALVLGWPEIARIARQTPVPPALMQGQLI